MKPESVNILEFKGPEAAKFIEEISRLRISIFREFPYLYDGDKKYEEKYLQTYFSCPESYVAICFDEERIIGASTAIPMKYEEENFKMPFITNGFDPSKICYFGESILMPQYRGLGIGKSFMKKREEFAKRIGGISDIAFAAVVRDQNHPLRPKNYQALNPFWKKMGFKEASNFFVYFPWKELGEKDQTPKKMQIWMKKIHGDK
jgi:GNAT superfamily N-acetyltransferase